ncbi:MAG: hypothetical protein SCH71_16430 [Desulfobulbaceae bacterium]|nr:hypothetical protein [Desulfobulbaceae bacterium]
MHRPIEIECLFAPGCASRQDTLALVKKVIGELGLAADIREIVIVSLEEAARCRFLGSPSIRVNGRDIESEADARTDFGMG